MAENIILDKDDNIIAAEDVDYEIGHLEPEVRIKEHHDAIEEVPEINHLAVRTFYFSDGTKYAPESEDDPHVLMKDDQLGIVDYVNLPGEEEKEVRGIDLYTIVDRPRQEAVKAWDETEDIQRYILYTEEELQHRKEEKERKAKETELLSSGLDRIKTLEENKNDILEKTNETSKKCNDIEVSVDDLTLMIAEMVAM